MGIVARNHVGAAAISVCSSVHCCSSAEEAEAVAIQVGLTELSKIYRDPVTVETDCASVAALLQPVIPNKTSMLYGDFRDCAMILVIVHSSATPVRASAMASTGSNSCPCS